MLTNFKNMGIKDSDIHVLLSVSKDINDKTNSDTVKLMYNKLKEKFNTVSFFEYLDTRIFRDYIPSIIPNTVKQHYKSHTYLKDSSVFLHDCDMIFTKPVNFSNLEKDNNCYVSDSRGFIYSDYILPKGQDLYEDMCDIIGVNYEIPIKHKDDSGGSQYIFKGTDYRFWHKVECDSENLYRYFQISEPKRLEKDPNYYGIQQFTAGMWSMLWNCWFYELPVKITSELDFCWGTDPIDKWDKCSIFHNSGVTEEISKEHNIFYKAKYTESIPYDDVNELEYSEKFGSWHYVNLIRDVSKNSCLT
jgi:hypothetical protein